jgi:mutator mutT protein
MRQQALFWQWSEALVAAAPGRGRDCNQALMDLGATLCTPRQPSCGLCPWRSSCAAYAAGTPDHYPVKDAPRSVPFQVIGVGVVLNAAGEVLIDQRLNEGLLGGLWEFPGGKQEPGEAIAHTIQRELQEELAIEVEVGEELISLEHAYSHKKLRFVVHLCRWRSGEPQPLASQQVRWVRPQDLDAYPFPAANTRIIAALRQHLGIAAAICPRRAEPCWQPGDPWPGCPSDPCTTHHDRSLPAVLCLGEALVDRLGPPGGDPLTLRRSCDDRLAPPARDCALAVWDACSSRLATMHRASS